MIPLFEAPKGYRFLKDGDMIQSNDIVCNDFGGAEFKVGPNHPEIGHHYNDSCMPMLRKEDSHE